MVKSLVFRSKSFDFDGESCNKTALMVQLERIFERKSTVKGQDGDQTALLVEATRTEKDIQKAM
jgi:hypothetical protein